MNPSAPLLRPDPLLELRRAGRLVGLAAATLAVILASGLVARILDPDPLFLWIHAAAALTALAPAGLAGGTFVALRGAGGWTRWTVAVLQVALSAIVCAALGVLVAGALLARLGHPVPYGLLPFMDAGQWGGMAVGGVCSALVLSGLAGLLLRGFAQARFELPQPPPRPSSARMPRI
jgi:hypothetical protein